jgi:hypothetical protein
MGKDSEWNPNVHDLIVRCRLPNPDRLRELFAEDGVAQPDAELLVALEWTSADSGWRQLGDVVSISQSDWPTGAIESTLRMNAGTIRGSGLLNLQLFLGRAGESGNQRLGFATQTGTRLGALVPPLTLVIDGDGSLFPVLEENQGWDQALWELRRNWADAHENTFSSEFVALVLNRDHELFGQLQHVSEAGRQSPLMRNILASWIALFVREVQLELDGTFDAFVMQAVPPDELATIAEAASGFVRAGQLDTTSASALFCSAQRWLDRRLVESEAAK